MSVTTYLSLVLSIFLIHVSAEYSYETLKDKENLDGEYDVRTKKYFANSSFRLLPHHCIEWKLWSCVFVKNISIFFPAKEIEWVFNQADQDNDDKLSKMELISLMVRSFSWSLNRFSQPNN